VIREARIVQDGHSAHEHAVYALLWEQGKWRTEESKTIQIGGDLIRKGTAMSKASARRALKGLIAKHAIKVIAECDPYTSEGKTYLVYSYPRILKHREAAGMKWAERKPGGKVVLLTDEESDQAVREGKRRKESARPAPAPAQATQADAPRQAPTQERTTDADEKAAIMRALEALEGADTKAPEQILAACQGARPGEILDLPRVLHAVAKHIGIALNPAKKIENPLAYVIAMAPRTYGGKGYEQDRARLEKRQEAERVATQQQLDQAEASRVELGWMQERDAMIEAEVRRLYPTGPELADAEAEAMQTRCREDKPFAEMVRRCSAKGKDDTAAQLIKAKVRDQMQLPTRQDWAMRHPAERNGLGPASDQ
jgi:hypothetical protein